MTPLRRIPHKQAIFYLFVFEIYDQINYQAKQHKMCGGQKNTHSRVSHRGIWVEEKWFKEVQLDQMELESIRTRGMCCVLGIIQSWRDTDPSSLCP